MTEETTQINPCARTEELLWASSQGELSAPDHVWLDEHLAACGDCAELASLWHELGELPAVAPDPSQRRRFHAMLAAHEANRRRRWFASEAWGAWLRPLPAALGLALLLATFGAGWWARGNRTNEQDQDKQIAALREEVHATNQLAVLSMLREQSPNDRLQGVSYTRQMRSLDPQISQALLHSLRYDPCPDVRLAALDALQSGGDTRGRINPEVARGLIEAFQDQNSPLVQVALVDSYVALRPPAARPLLQRISDDPTYNAEVRQRAAWGLSQWD